MAEIATLAPRGSEIGIRRSVARLVGQGVVSAVRMGRNDVHELNRDHVAAPIAGLLAGLRVELWRRLRETLGRWEPKPVYACAFGSSARREGGTDSDIDILLVRPGIAELATADPRPSGPESEWQSQIDDLHAKVVSWTGNRLHVVELSFQQWIDRLGTDPAFFVEVGRDAVDLAGTPSLVPDAKAR